MLVRVFPPWEDSMDLGLKDRVAVVAASSQGLGRAVAMGLAREGAKLALCARNAATIEAAAVSAARPESRSWPRPSTSPIMTRSAGS